MLLYVLQYKTAIEQRSLRLLSGRRLGTCVAKTLRFWIPSIAPRLLLIAKQERRVVLSHASRRSRISYVSSVALTIAPCLAMNGCHFGYVELVFIILSLYCLPYKEGSDRRIDVGAKSPSANTSAWLHQRCFKQTSRSWSSPGAISQPSSSLIGTLPSRLYACCAPPSTECACAEA